MRLIGLTGGIATGKSSVARRLQAHGAFVIDSDRLAREVVAPGEPGHAAVVTTFGAGVVAADGGIDRRALGAIVFADPDARRRLEAITHPPVQVRTAALIGAGLASDAALVVCDVPLLYEAGREALFEGVMVVWCDPATQMRRLIARDGAAPGDAAARIDAQLPIDEKRDRATWVIDNAGDEAARDAQVDTWWNTWVRAT